MQESIFFSYVFLSDVPDIVDVLDPSFMSDNTHWDGVLAHLRRHILVHLKTQVPQNQVAWRHRHRSDDDVLHQWNMEKVQTSALISPPAACRQSNTHRWRCRQTGRGLWLDVSALQGLLGKSLVSPGREKWRRTIFLILIWAAKCCLSAESLQTGISHYDATQ